MKKSLSLYLFTVISTLLLGNISAQPVRKKEFNETVRLMPKAGSVIKSADKDALDQIRKYSEKTFKHFTRNFQSATGVRLFPDKKGLRMTFNIDGNVVRAMYDKNGRSMYYVKTFPFTDLPQNVIYNVEFAFPGFSVYGHVTDVNVGNKKARLILIENKTEWKRIRLVGGEMDVYEEYTKPL
jgi:hypothetical protein